MYFTDRGIEELADRRGEEQVTLEWLAERLRSSSTTTRSSRRRSSGSRPGWPASTTRTERAVLVAALVGAALLVGCSAEPSVPASAASPAKSVPTGTTPAGTLTDARLAERVTEARADLARSEGVPTEDVVVLSAQRVTWPDSALGCPATEHTYEPGAVPGYRIVLHVGGRTVRYHGARDEAPRACLMLD